MSLFHFRTAVAAALLVFAFVSANASEPMSQAAQPACSGCTSSTAASAAGDTVQSDSPLCHGRIKHCLLLRHHCAPATSTPAPASSPAAAPPPASAPAPTTYTYTAYQPVITTTYIPVTVTALAASQVIQAPASAPPPPAAAQAPAAAPAASSCPEHDLEAAIALMTRARQTLSAQSDGGPGASNTSPADQAKLVAAVEQMHKLLSQHHQEIQKLKKAQESKQ